jgi:hypothetical protein
LPKGGKIDRIIETKAVEEVEGEDGVGERGHQSRSSRTQTRELICPQCFFLLFFYFSSFSTTPYRRDTVLAGWSPSLPVLKTQWGNGKLCSRITNRSNRADRENAPRKSNKEKRKAEKGERMPGTMKYGGEKKKKKGKRGRKREKKKKGKEKKKRGKKEKKSACQKFHLVGRAPFLRVAALGELNFYRAPRLIVPDELFVVLTFVDTATSVSPAPPPPPLFFSSFSFLSLSLSLFVSFFLAPSPIPVFFSFLGGRGAGSRRGYFGASIVSLHEARATR